MIWMFYFTLTSKKRSDGVNYVVGYSLPAIIFYHIIVLGNIMFMISLIKIVILFWLLTMGLMLNINMLLIMTIRVAFGKAGRKSSGSQHLPRKKYFLPTRLSISFLYVWNFMLVKVKIIINIDIFFHLFLVDSKYFIHPRKEGHADLWLVITLSIV